MVCVGCESSRHRAPRSPRDDRLRQVVHGREFNSLDAQREACTAYIERQAGWNIITERYDDGGFTGTNIDRPAFTRLMDDAEAGVSFVSVTQNFTTADAMGRLTMNMLMSFAEFERDKADEPGLVPTRVHGLFRGLHGLYACVNAHCEGRQSELVPIPWTPPM